MGARRTSPTSESDYLSGLSSGHEWNDTKYSMALPNTKGRLGWQYRSKAKIRAEHDLTRRQMARIDNGETSGDDDDLQRLLDGSDLLKSEMKIRTGRKWVCDRRRSRRIQHYDSASVSEAELSDISSAGMSS